MLVSLVVENADKSKYEYLCGVGTYESLTVAAVKSFKRIMDYIQMARWERIHGTSCRRLWECPTEIVGL